jgi:hypothetical protein
MANRHIGFKKFFFQNLITLTNTCCFLLGYYCKPVLEAADQYV